MRVGATASERMLLIHCDSRTPRFWPIRRLGRHWTYELGEIRAPTLYRTRREAVRALSAYLAVIREGIDRACPHNIAKDRRCHHCEQEALEFVEEVREMRQTLREEPP